MGREEAAEVAEIEVGGFGEGFASGSVAATGGVCEWDASGSLYAQDAVGLPVYVCPPTTTASYVAPAEVTQTGLMDWLAVVAVTGAHRSKEDRCSVELGAGVGPAIMVNGEPVNCGGGEHVDTFRA